MFGGLFYVPFFLQTVRGLGAMTVGLLLLPQALVMAIMMPLSGKLYDRFGPRIPVGIGILFSAYGTYLLTYIDINTPYNTIILWNIIRSVGMGMTMMPLQTALMAVIPQAQIGRASAITNIITRVASSFGLAILTVLLTNWITQHSSYLAWNISSSNLNSLAASGGFNLSQVMSLLQLNLANISFVQGLNEMFYITSGITLIAVIPVFLLPKKEKKKKGSDPILAE